MNLAEVVARVQAQCPSFVTVTHAFSAPEDYGFPAAVVAPVQYDASDNSFMDDTTVRQFDTRRFGVYIMLRRASDPDSGPTRADLFDTLHQEVLGALRNFNSADPEWMPMIYAGGALRTFEQGAPAVWRDDFTTRSYQP